MNVKLTYKEIRIVERALQNRVEDLRKFAFEAENQHHEAVRDEFTEMANECALVLKSIRDQKKEMETAK